MVVLVADGVGMVSCGDVRVLDGRDGTWGGDRWIIADGAGGDCWIVGGCWGWTA